MKLRDVVRRIERAVPPDWALPDDPVGLHLGNPEDSIVRVLVGLEASTDFVQQAIASRANLVLVHHPLIYRSLKKVLENNPVQRLVRELIRHDIALYAAHTNFDLHPQGMAPLWAKKLGCSICTPLAQKPQGRQLKLVTFVPTDYTDRIREALGKAGAGHIGDYSFCSFCVQGEGSFLGSEHTQPFLGSSGVFERAVEDRLEMILPERAKWSVVKALYDVHPYEEPAYELYPLDEFRDLDQAIWIGEFSESLEWSEWIARIQASLPKGDTLVEIHPDLQRRIKRIALSTGSGSSMISQVSSLGVDAYLTGEVGYHSLWEARESGLNVVLAGHDRSESFFAEAIIPLMKKTFEDESGCSIEWIAETWE